MNTSDLDTIKEAIDKLKTLDAKDLNEGIDYVCRFLQKLKTPIQTEPFLKIEPKDPTSFNHEKLQKFEVLSKILLQSDKWAEAASPRIIVNLNDKQALIDNANQILDDFIGVNLKGKTFVEYYTRDDGYVAAVSKERGAVSSLVIYPDAIPTQIDIAYSFDCIEYQKNISQKIKALKPCLKDTGRYYLRCHNYFSRYASRLYRKHNYAYLHLIFTKDELMKLFPGCENDIMTNFGLEEGIYGEDKYDKMITEAGYKIISKIPTYEPLESFFTLDGILDRIKKNIPQVEDFNKERLTNLMELQFIDYQLGV